MKTSELTGAALDRAVIEAAIGADFKWDIFERDMLDDEHQKNFKEPWICVAADGEVREFKTEDEACAFQISEGETR